MFTNLKDMTSTIPIKGKVHTLRLTTAKAQKSKDKEKTLNISEV
jgi:hypothetical protein